MGKPGIILTSQFTVPNKKNFSKYVQYMTRKEALNERKESLTQEESHELEMITNVIRNYDMKKGNSYLLNSYGKGLSDKELEARKIIKSKELFASDTDYIKYISYMSRQCALEKKGVLSENEKKELEVVRKRVTDINKTTKPNLSHDISIKEGVFSIDKEKMTINDIEEVNQIIKNAQNNGSIFYQDVISFDTDFLIKNKLYDPETDELDEKRIRYASKKMMSKMFEDEDIHHGYWFASIHRNTDHIHIHFGTVETQNTRPLIEVEEEGIKYIAPKGKRKQKTLDNMKSVFANSLVDRSVELSRISFLRNTLVQDIKETYLQKDAAEQARLLKEIYNELPSNKKHWQYGSKYISDSTREKINKITDSLMKNNPDYKEYFLRTEEESEYRKSLFGDSERSEKDYAINKKKDIQKRLGNALLSEMKRNANSLTYNKNAYHSKRNFSKNKKPNYIAQRQSPFISHRDIYHIKRAINDDFEKYKAEKDYEQLQKRIAWEQQQNRL